MPEGRDHWCLKEFRMTAYKQLISFRHDVHANRSFVCAMIAQGFRNMSAQDFRRKAPAVFRHSMSVHSDGADRLIFAGIPVILARR
jgi:hypothetical protein